LNGKSLTFKPVRATSYGMNQKSLMYPDRVLALVVLILSTLMIAGTAYLINAESRFENFSASIVKDSERKVQVIQINRASLSQEESEETE